MKRIYWRLLKRAEGKRFIFLHRVLRRHWKRNLLAVISLISLSLLCLFIGILLLFLPGPGLLFILLSLLPLIYLSKRFAHRLDRLEILLNQWWQRGKRYWRRKRSSH